MAFRGVRLIRRKSGPRLTALNGPVTRGRTHGVRGCDGDDEDRPHDASHQILIGQLGNRDWYLLSGAPIAVAGSLRRLPTRPKQPGASKGTTTRFTPPAY